MPEKQNKLSSLLNYLSFKSIIRDIFLVILTIIITTHYNDSRQNIKNYERLTLELEWNLSELRDYNESLENLESYLNSYKSLSVKGGQAFNPMFKSLPMRFPFRYSLVKKDSNIKEGQLERFEPQPRNYIISELEKNGFLYQLKNKEYIKYIEKMSEPNWLLDIISPISAILEAVDNLPKQKEFNSEKAAIEQKQKIENECNKIISKVVNLRNFVKDNITQLEEIILYINELA